MGSPTHATEVAAAPPAGPASRRGAVLAILCAGMFLVLLDVTIVNVALPGIGRALGTGLPGLQGVVDGYAVAIAGLLLHRGRPDRHRGGRRRDARRPPAHAGLAGGFSNTARQVGTALGVAVYGAVAGPALHPESAAGLHVLAWASAALWLSALALIRVVPAR